jgi:putative oxidoreductase
LEHDRRLITRPHMAVNDENQGAECYALIGWRVMNLLRLSTSPLPVPASWYAIPLRLIVGFGFIQHGYAKLARGPEDFIGVLHAMGLPLPFLLGWLTIIVELVGGLMILLGALIPLATIPMMIVLFVAIITVHLPNGFSSIKLSIV